MFEENEIALRNAVEKYMDEHNLTASEVRFVSHPSTYVRQQHFVGRNRKEIREAMSQASPGPYGRPCDYDRKGM